MCDCLQADDDEKIAERDDGETKEKGGGPDQSAKKDPFMPEQASIKTAMDLFGLEHFKIIREPADDTKVLVGWNDDTVVLAFRGTNSFVNAKTDAQVRTSAKLDVHDGLQSHACCRSCPEMTLGVHS